MVDHWSMINRAENVSIILMSFWVKNREKLLIGLSILFSLISLYWFYLGLRLGSTTKSGGVTSVEMSSSNTRKTMLPGGKQLYRFSHGVEVKGPKINTLTISELTPKKGQRQTLTIEIESESEVSTVKFAMRTDNQEKILVFKKIEEAEGKSKWETAWMVDDTMEERYQLGVEIANETENYSDVLIFR